MFEIILIVRINMIKIEIEKNCLWEQLTTSKIKQLDQYLFAPLLSSVSLCYTQI